MADKANSPNNAATDSKTEGNRDSPKTDNEKEQIATSGDATNPNGNDKANNRAAKTEQHRHDWFDLTGLIINGIIGLATIVAAIFAGYAAVVFSDQLATMRQANEDARQSFIDGHRSFVFLSRFDEQPALDERGKVVEWAISYIFENTGDTPTKSLITGANAAQPINPDKFVEAFPPDIAAAARSGIPGRITNGAVIRPHATSTTEGFLLSVDEIQRIADQKDKMFVWGWAEYNDIFVRTPCHRIRYLDEILVQGDFRKIPQPGEKLPLKFAVRGKFGDPDDICTHARN